MQRFFKNKNGSLYIFDDSYARNELNIRICNITHCDTTMICKESLVDFAEKLKIRKPIIETDRSDYVSAYFAAEILENGYIFRLRNIVNMSVELNFKQVDKLITYLSSNIC